MSHRVLAIDVGVWNFSYAIVSCPTSGLPSVYTIEQWDNGSLPAMAGYPTARAKISGNDISMTLLTDICFAALARLFPAAYILHHVDKVWIESQPRFKGKAGKIAELSYSIYAYFRAMVDGSQLCCWRFPDLQMVGAVTKFDGGSFFGLVSTDLTTVPSKGAGYTQRKQYGVRLVGRLLENDHTLQLLPGLREKYQESIKKDDYCDSLLLAGVALRCT